MAAAASDRVICVCYDVSLRKLVHFARRVRPERPSRMTECLSAGTGCGWCIPTLVEIARDPDAFDIPLSEAAYAAARQAYLQNRDARNSFDKLGGPDND